MSVNFSCPKCAHPISLAERQAAANLTCPNCGHALKTPNATTDSARSTQAAVARSTKKTSLPEPKEPPLTLRSRPSIDTEMDMTPMVDVVFLLLIFFMVTAAFSLQKSIEIPPPEAEASGRPQRDIQEDSEYVVVRVDSDNVFWINSAASDTEQEAHSQPDLLIKLREARAAGGGASGPNKLLVMASGDARHEYVVKALDAGTAVGMDEIKLATIEDDE